MKSSIVKKFIGGVITLVVILIICMAGQLWETNTAGQFQIKQAAISGEMTVRFDPGMYMQSFGSIYTYKNVATVGFGAEKGEGSADIDAIPVIFNDGSKATITGLVRVRLPQDLNKALALKKEYSQGYEHFIRSGVVPIVKNAVKLSANLRSAQDAYTTLAIFQQAVEDQLKNGPYVTKSDTIEVQKSTGDKEIIKVTKIVLNKKTGEPERLNNRFKELGCDVTEVVIDVPQFDKQVESMIAKRKDEAMKTELAKQQAIRAKQDAITIAEQGKADVAKAEAAALVEKKTAVVAQEKDKEVAVLAAQKKFEVAKFEAKEALEKAKKIKAEGMAKAAANLALVRAGLTPLEKAQIRKDTMIGMMEAWSKRPVPSTIFGGSSKNGGSVVMDMLGVDAAFNAIERMNKKEIK